MSLVLAACGGGGGGGSTDNNNPGTTGSTGNNNPGTTGGNGPATYTVGGTASGLKGSGLSLSINGGNNLAIPNNGAFVFGTMFRTGQPYNVTVATQPTGPVQTCALTNGANTVASSNVVDIAVVCVDAEVRTYTISGMVSGLIGPGLVLQNNGGDGRAVSSDGPFSFATALASGAAYWVTVATQPTNPTQQCAITNGSGTIAVANVTNVSVVCAVPPSPPPPPPPTTLASVSPARLFAIHDEGDSRTLRAVASPGAPLAGGLFIRSSGGEQVFEGIFQSGLPDRTFELSTETRKTLSAGTYSGEITVELCKDDQCAVPYPGAPVRVPYEVRVMSPTPNLTPLSAVPNGQDWQTPHGGSAAHTGYVPITIDSATFTRRFKWLPQDPKVNSLSDVVTYQGQAFVTTNVLFGRDPGGGFSAIGISESTGQTSWVHPFERGPDLSVALMNPPTVDNGKVYALVSGNFGGVSAFALNSANGDQIWRSGFTGTLFLDAPTISGNRLISHGGRAGGLVSLDAGTGVVQWLSGGENFFQSGSVAAEGAVLYSVMPKTQLSFRPVLRGFDQSTGNELYSIDTSPPLDSISLNEPSPTPVVTGANSVLIGYRYGPDDFSKYRLEKFDTQNLAVSWSVDSDTVDSLPFDPVVANGVVYVVNIGLNQLEARRESDGTVLWTWTPPMVDQSRLTFGGARMIVTNNLLFAATDRFVYAISLASRTEVWLHWNSGTLAMSANGVLYVKSSGTFIDAINLK